MEGCESLDSEMAELQELQDEALSQDDEDEIEELQNSLREVVQDQSVKPKLQCLMVDPSFSMVTVQSEDSGIIWETASSRCSTPWASEASSTSEAYSMEGSGGAGKITIVFDEDKVVRRRTRSGGRSSRLGDRLSRPGSSRSASALGVERPEMAEVSLPNIQEEKTPTKAELEELKSKDQQLFSLISEGYEILNIRVPSKLPTVDEEESTDLQDNLSFLDQTPKIRSRNHHDWTQQRDQLEAEQTPIHPDSSEDTSRPLPDKQHERATSETESTADIDYIEKFTLLDVVIPEEAPPQQLEEEKLSVKAPTEELQTVKEATEDGASVSEDSFVFVTDTEIVGEHLDEVFYGEGPPIEALKQKGEGVERMRSRRESQRSMKDGGLVLFETEETKLTPIFISPGPPKIIDPILLEEPTAMSFMYSDLYEDALGEKRRSDEEYSEPESVASEKSYKRRLSDSDEADGYLEKFRLKDETPAAPDQSESAEDEASEKMVWAQSKFEMTGCLIRAAKDEETEMTKNDEAKMQEVPEMIEEKIESSTEAEEKHSSVMAQEETLEEIPEDSHHESKSVDCMESKQEQQAVEPSTEKSLETPQMKNSQCTDETITAQSFTETKLPCETQRQAERMSEQLAVTPDATTSTLPESREDPPACSEPTLQTETTEKTLSEEVAPIESKVETADEKPSPEPIAEVKQTENTTLTSTAPLSGSVASSEVSVLEDKEGSSEDVAPLEVITDCDCDCVVQTTEQAMEKAVCEEEIQAQVKTDMQEVTEALPPFEAVEHHKNLTEESSEERKAAAADQESEVKMDTSAEIPLSAKPKEIQLESTHKHDQMQQENTTDCESVNLNQTGQPTSRKSAEDCGTCVQDVVNVGDELILLVPKGQAVEMDIQIDQWSEAIIAGTGSTPEPDISSEVQQPELQLEEEPIVAEKEELFSDELDLKPLAPAHVEDASTAPEDLESHGEKLVSSLLRSFKPQEDLSEICGDDIRAEESEEKTDFWEIEGKAEISLPKEDAPPCLDEYNEEQTTEQSEMVLETREENADDLGYEVIGEEDAKGLLESEIQREEGEVESCQRPEEKMETEVDKVELIESDYEIIDAEEEKQACLAAELQGLDWFCYSCRCLLSEEEYKSAGHHGHQVCLVEKAYEDIKETLGSWISELQERSENIEDLVSELELAYNSVEDQFTEGEATMRAQNEDMMALVMEQYNTMSVSMEEEKKAKLEQLYDKIVSYQENIDSAKATLDTAAREAETEARSPEDIHARLQAALDSALTLELGPKGLLVFEDYTKTSVSSSNLTQRKGIPVPQRPTLQPQDPGSASSTSVTVYWKVSPGDIIDCFQVYCVEDPQGAVSEEYRVTVKESYCILEDLQPDRMYKVWVMAVNYTGCSLPSERLLFRTAPSVPVIDTERCSVMWDSATLRWSSAKASPGLSYTLEYCRQYELEGEGLRSISGIEGCEQTVVLQPNENYLFYIKAVNGAGASEQSEAALVSTKGTRFQLLKSSAHPALKLSDDHTTLQYSQDACQANAPTNRESPSILGELLPPRGLHYWEAVVSESPSYRLGVTCSADHISGSLGENSSSWCLQCTPGPSGCRYQLLHDNLQSSVFATETPERVGTFLDHQGGRLSFYNACSGQLLGSFPQRFSRPCHPALALDQPGCLQVCMVPETPPFTKDKFL